MARMHRPAIVAVTASLGTVSLAGVLAMSGATTAGFSDSTYARVDLTTTAPDRPLPVPQDQTSGGVLYLDDAGQLYLGGVRMSGDGAGGFGVGGPGAGGNDADGTYAPLKSSFPSDVHITNVIGVTRNYDFRQNVNTSYLALGGDGSVWTWGWSGGGTANLGRGSLSGNQRALPGKVTRTDADGALPRIASIARAHEQFLALDYDGTLWAWGGGENGLPVVAADKRTTSAYPIRANSTTLTQGYSVRCDTGPDAYGDVTWHALGSGSTVSGAVAQNGMVYTWGADNSDGLAPGSANNTCPLLNEGMNRALFQDYPDLYRTADGLTYDEATLPDETSRHARFLAIADAMKNTTLPACAGVNTNVSLDPSGCPVRKLLFRPQTGFLLTSQGNLYSLAMGNGNNSDLRSLLGRTSGAAPTSPGYAYRPGKVDFPGTTSPVDQLTAGFGHINATLQDGTTWGWGLNQRCQAIGGRQNSGSCNGWANEVLTAPVRVRGLDDAGVVTLYAGGCATWAETRDGSLYAWGGGTMSGGNYYSCDDYKLTDNVPNRYGYRSVGYKIYNFMTSSPGSYWGAPVGDTSTGTIRIR